MGVTVPISDIITGVLNQNDIDSEFGCLAMQEQVYTKKPLRTLSRKIVIK
jgi:hypothetical protein